MKKRSNFYNVVHQIIYIYVFMYVTAEIQSDKKKNLLVI